MRRIFCDMDGVIVDFDALMRELGVNGDQICGMKGAFEQMKPIPGAIEHIHKLIEDGFDVWLATKPPTDYTHAHTEKANWVKNYLPTLLNKLITTSDKGLLGQQGDFLIDDRPHKANCMKFPGVLIHYRDGFGWPEIYKYIHEEVRSEVKIGRNNE